MISAIIIGIILFINIIVYCGIWVLLTQDSEYNGVRAVGKLTVLQIVALGFLAYMVMQ